MSSMTATYRGALTPQERIDIDGLQRFGMSVRSIAKELGISYGKVRTYAEWKANSLPDLKPPPAEGPKILIFDVETSFQEARGFFHSKFKVNIQEVIRESHLLTFAYMWLGDEEAQVVSQRHDPNYQPGTEDDRYVAVRLHRLFSQADIVVAHYGDRFDIPYANERFLFNGLGPYPPIQSVDTKTHSSTQFKQVSHSLGHLTHKYGLTEKMHNSGWDLWVGCVEGREEAWDEMEEYNLIDVYALRDWYLFILPFMGQNGKKKHPNLGHYWRTETPVCPNCGGRHLVTRGWTPHRTQHYEYATMRCSDCGTYKKQAGVRRRIDKLDRIYAV